MNFPIMSLDEAHKRLRAEKAAKKFIPQAAKEWSNFTDRPWNRIAMERVLTEFALHLSRTTGADQHE